MNKTYNPFEISPEKFYSRFVDLYENWQNYGFMKMSTAPRKDSFTPICTMYSGGKRKSILIKAFANLEVFPYSQKLIYSSIKIENLGSIFIAGPDLYDIKNAKIDLERLTGIRIREVKTFLKGGKNEC